MEAIVYGEQRYTFAAYNRRVNRLANALRGLGVGKGDKVADDPWQQPGTDGYVLGMRALGAVIVPMSPLLRGAGLTRLLNDSDSATIITSPDFAAF